MQNKFQYKAWANAEILNSTALLDPSQHLLHVSEPGRRPIMRFEFLADRPEAIEKPLEQVNNKGTLVLVMQRQVA